MRGEQRHVGGHEAGDRDRLGVRQQRPDGAVRRPGAVVRALVVSALDSFLIEAEQGVEVGVLLDLPQGTRLIFLGAIMALVLIVRPSGLTGGREFRLVR